MHIFVVGLNHRSAPVELRERLVFTQESLPGIFTQLRERVGLEESIVLSTCNRVEIYGRADDLDGSLNRLRHFLSQQGSVEPGELNARLYTHTEPNSVHHLFSVASGLDSMVLGEGEILQQVKRAYEQAKACGATGKIFNALFQRALNTAKAVRTNTAIARGATSIGTVAVELAEKIFDPLSKAVVVLVGAGKIGELTLKRLTDRGVRDVRVVNRSMDRAASLAAAYQARPVPLGQLGCQLLDADIIITSTSAPGFALRQSELATIMRLRHQKPLCIVDLGVPRNVEPAIGELENVYLFDIDDLQGVVAHTHRGRELAVNQSRVIIDQKVERFLAWWQEEGRSCPAGASSLERAQAS